jgi:putative flavoprotein involved in K+ transport
VTSSGDLSADAVVVCTGAFQRPYRPPAGTWPDDLLVLDATEYRNPMQLPPGNVLVIGSGQTGCQLAEELHLSGRSVFLSCGRAPWGPRRLDEVDIVTWAHRVRFFDQRLDELPSPAGRLLANPQATGARGGHDLHFRTLQRLGVVLLGRLAGVSGHRADFVDDLGASVAFGDARWADLCAALRTGLPARGYPVPELPVADPFRYDPVDSIDLHGFGTVIFTSGFRPDYSWIDFDVTDSLGFPVTIDGASPTVPGLSFCGIHFMRVRRSGFLFGVGEDATLVAERVAASVCPTAASADVLVRPPGTWTHRGNPEA